MEELVESAIRSVCVTSEKEICDWIQNETGRPVKQRLVNAALLSLLAKGRVAKPRRSAAFRVINGTDTIGNGKGHLRPESVPSDMPELKRRRRSTGRGRAAAGPTGPAKDDFFRAKAVGDRKVSRSPTSRASTLRRDEETGQATPVGKDLSEFHRNTGLDGSSSPTFGAAVPPAALPTPSPSSTATVGDAHNSAENTVADASSVSGRRSARLSGPRSRSIRSSLSSSASSSSLLAPRSRTDDNRASLRRSASSVFSDLISQAAEHAAAEAAAAAAANQRRQELMTSHQREVAEDQLHHPVLPDTYTELDDLVVAAPVPSNDQWNSTPPTADDDLVVAEEEEKGGAGAAADEDRVEDRSTKGPVQHTTTATTNGEKLGQPSAGTQPIDTAQPPSSGVSTPLVAGSPAADDGLGDDELDEVNLALARKSPMLLHTPPRPGHASSAAVKCMMGRIRRNTADYSTGDDVFSDFFERRTTPSTSSHKKAGRASFMSSSTAQAPPHSPGAAAGVGASPAHTAAASPALDDARNSLNPRRFRVGPLFPSKTAAAAAAVAPNDLVALTALLRDARVRLPAPTTDPILTNHLVDLYNQLGTFIKTM